MNRTQNDFFGGLVSAVRDNPLAAALIGGGALWLLIGEKKLKGAASSATAAASSAVNEGTRNLREAASRFHTTAAPPTAPEMDQEGSFRVGETLRQAGAAASDAISGAADRVRDRFDEGVAYAQDNFAKLNNPLPGKEAFAKAHSSLSDVLERQPLVLGAIGLAIGAAAASAFAISDVENDWVGDLSDGVKADMSGRAGAVTQSLREASDTLKAELQDTGAEAVDRVKQAGMDAIDAAREKVKLP
jgi:hypothetical protein